MPKKSRKLLSVFLLAFAFNFIWENLHSALYVHYKSGPISEFVLLRAAFADAIFITLLAALFIKIPYFQKRVWDSLIFGFVAAVILEVFALRTGRWAYQDIMPIVPLVKTGLTPTIQLGILSYLIYKITGVGKK